MNKQYDVIIIGGGPTGSTAGIFLAREGMKVLILEKEKFPREHVGESMLPFCYDLFEDIGVLDHMKKHFTRKPGVTFSNADGSKSSHWCFDKILTPPHSLSFHARRSLFDEMMLNQARTEGAEAIEMTYVTAVDLASEGLGVKVHVSNSDNEDTVYDGKFLIDASGQDCFLAKKLNNQKPFERLNVRLALSSHWANPKYNESLANGNITIVHFGGEKLGWIWLIPLGPDRLSVGLAINMSYANEQRKLLMPIHGAKKWQEAFYLSELSQSDLVMSIIDGASMCWDVVSNGDFSYYAEKKYGNNYAMLGDAGAFLDPIFSSGIYLGMKSAKLITPGIVDIIKKGDYTAFEDGYRLMDKGYAVVEDLILAFYEPSAMAFPELAGSEGISHEQFEAIYTIYHMLLAGDFFNDSERYRKAIAALRDPEMVKKYLALKQHDRAEDFIHACSGSLMSMA